MHSLSAVRADYCRRITAAAAADARVVGLLDYGATSHGRGDEWSDLDLALLVRDAAVDDFRAEWRQWAAQFGPLLLAYISGVGHPWVIFDTEPIPLRVDLNILPQAELATLRSWPIAPTSVAAAVLYDDSDGALSRLAADLVGQSLAPADPEKLFHQVCGDFWYYLLRTQAKVERGQAWLAYWEHNFIILGNLAALLRLEAGTLARLRASQAIADIERVITPERLAQLERCRPGADLASIRQALRAAAELGALVCAAVAAREGWPWPAALAARVRALL